MRFFLSHTRQKVWAVGHFGKSLSTSIFVDRFQSVHFSLADYEVQYNQASALTALSVRLRVDLDLHELLDRWEVHSCREVSVYRGFFFLRHHFKLKPSPLHRLGQCVGFWTTLKLTSDSLVPPIFSHYRDELKHVMIACGCFKASAARSDYRIKVILINNRKHQRGSFAWSRFQHFAHKFTTVAILTNVFTRDSFAVIWSPIGVTTDCFRDRQYM